MIIPVPSLWPRQKLEDADDRIDRAVSHRSHRLMAGLSIGQSLNNINGALTVTVGQGKYLRLKHVVEASTAIPDSISTQCRRFSNGETQDIGRLAALLSDLAEIQSSVVQQLKCQAGKYVDRVIAVSVAGPGIWIRDFDGRPNFRGFCDATRLAELSGLSVIDDFPSRDIAVGGSGAPLECVPLWLMFADRDPKIASQNRVILMANEQVGVYQLPASDGLDADLPPIVEIAAPGIEFLKDLPRLLQDWTGNQELEPAKLYAEGIADPLLRERLVRQLVETKGNRDADSSGHRGAINDHDVSSQLNGITRAYVCEERGELSNLIRTLIVVIVDRLVNEIKHCQPISRISVAASPSWEACLINRLQQVVPSHCSVRSVADNGITGTSLSAAIASFLGILHIDQMPANVPWLTGAASQRILGHLTPGRPANWRQLVRMMADFKPPAMKLKDAI